MLKVSQKLEYAMRAMIELAQRPRRGRPRPGARDRRASADPAPVPRAAARRAAQGRAWWRASAGRAAAAGCRALPRTSRWPTSRTPSRGRCSRCSAWSRRDHTCFQDSRCGLQGFWADVAACGAGRVPPDDGGGPRGPPPGGTPGRPCIAPGAAVVAAELGRPGRRPPARLGLFLPRIRMTFVPHTGHVP